jgi:uncharacterized protein
MNALVVLGNLQTPAMETRLPASSPPLIHLLNGDPPLVFMVHGSRLFEVDPDFFTELNRVDHDTRLELLETAQVWPQPAEDPALSPPSAITLNIAQSCNLSCDYCYAGEGRFGGQAMMMTDATACAAIDHVIQGAAGHRVSIGFMGGEPFLNRNVLYSAVQHAVARAESAHKRVTFSITTNATLLNDQDLDFLREHSFAISVSLDGPGDLNDPVRRTHNGTSAFATALRLLTPLLREPGKTRIAARVTITRRDLRVLERLEPLWSIGFMEAGVSPVRSSPASGLALAESDWQVLLEQMKRVAEGEWLHFRHSGKFRFSNLAIAIKQLHAGHCQPLPCGSGDSYVSVSARGEYFTCHRTIDDGRFALGSLQDGPSLKQRQTFLSSRHVDRQEPCRSCWARYLCGGGCHAEVLNAGRSGCDYIRGWLDYCLRYYDRTLREFPTWFQNRRTAL